MRRYVWHICLLLAVAALVAALAFVQAMSRKSIIERIDAEGFQVLLDGDVPIMFTHDVAELEHRNQRRQAIATYLVENPSRLDFRSDTQPSSDTVKLAASLYGLDTISLWGEQVDDSMVASLAAAKSVWRLEIHSPAVTQQCLVSIAEMPKLNHLDLDGCYLIDDDAVELLVRMKQLRTLSIRGTGITDKSVDRLRNALPNCNVRH